MILGKIRNKNHQIWSSYEREIRITNFNSRLKERDELFMCSSSQFTWHFTVQIAFNAEFSRTQASGPVVLLLGASALHEVMGSNSYHVIFFFQFRKKKSLSTQPTNHSGSKPINASAHLSHRI